MRLSGQHNERQRGEEITARAISHQGEGWNSRASKPITRTTDSSELTGSVKGGSQRSASEAGVERQCESTITVLEDVSSSRPRGRVHSSSEGLAYSDKGELSSESAQLAGQLFQPCRCKAQGSIGRFFALAKDATDSQTAQYPEVAERRQRAAER